ncbi:MAG TPA: TolC family protein [Candidatus Angelobacter sp.]
MRTKAVLTVVISLLGSVPSTAQVSIPGTVSPSSVQQAQPITPAQTSAPDAFNGSAMVDKLVPDVIHLTILDAIDRGLKHNLGLLLSQQQTQAARAQYRRNLSALLPNVSAGVSDSVNQINLAAFGIPTPVTLSSPVVGPFGLFQTQASMSATVMDFRALNEIRAATENERTANLSLQDARELVVLAVGNQYLLALAEAALVDTTQAQLNTAQAIFQQAQDMKKAGVSPAIDVLRAQVQMQAQQQQVLAARNQFAQQKMRLARAIGLPVSQQFELTDKVPYAPLPDLNLEEALARAYQRRPEYLAAVSRVRSAELEVKAAKGEGLPTVQINGQYGVNGPSQANAEQVYGLSGGINIPVFQGGKVKADVALAETNLRQNKMQLEDLHNRVELEVRSSWLDVKTSDDQVAVARQSIGLAAEQLKEAQDRFGAGVAGSLEVVQAQEAVANANETFIQALYTNNVAKLSLAHALGVAEQQTKAFLGGK